MDMGTPLKNYRHELFALAIFKGMTQRDAALEAGYKPSRVDVTASELVRNSKVFDRILELGRKAESGAIMSVRERKERLSEISRANLPDFITEEGIRVGKDSPNVGAVSEITSVTRRLRGGEPLNITKLKLHPPVPAMAELNKMEHIYGDHEMTPPTEIVQNFVFLLPDGTRVFPGELNRPKEVTSDDRSRKTD